MAFGDHRGGETLSGRTTSGAGSNCKSSGAETSPKAAGETVGTGNNP